MTILLWQTPAAAKRDGPASAETLQQCWNDLSAADAGVAYTVTKNFKVELAYRYLNLGSVTDTIDCVGGCNPDSYKFGNLYSHDIKLGLRWTCCDLPPPPPLRSKG